jgi:hypothetical protein
MAAPFGLVCDLLKKTKAEMSGDFLPKLVRRLRDGDSPFEGGDESLCVSFDGDLSAEGWK